MVTEKRLYSENCHLLALAGIPFLSEANCILCSYLVGCCPTSDLSRKGEPILGEAYTEPNIGSPLPNKSDIGQAADQTTVLLFPPRILIFLIIRVNYFKS